MAATQTPSSAETEQASSPEQTSGFANFFSKYGLYAFGRACCLSWAVIIASQLLFPVGFFKTVLFLAGALVANLITWMLARKLYSQNGIRALAIVGAVLCVVPIVTWLILPNIPESLLFALLAFAGLGTGVLFSIGGIIPCALSLEDSMFFPVAESFLEAVVIFIAFMLFREEAAAIFVVILPVISAVTVLPFKGNLIQLMQENAPMKTRRSDIKALLQSSCAIFSIMLLFGIVFGLLCFNSTYTWVYLIGLLLAGAFKLYDSTHNRRFEVNFIIKVLAPVVCAVLLFCNILPLNIFVFAVLVMVFVAETCRIVSHTAASNYMHVYQLNPVSNISVMSIVLFFGMIVGYLIAGVMVKVPFFTEGAEITPIILNLVVLIVVIMQAFVFKDNYLPFTEHKALAEMSQESGADMDRHTSPWKDRCTAFANSYGLTPRQAETLLLAAKGYSTSYIMETLCVSSHTAKAHLFAIYQKTDTHSRQELIEKIEAFDMASWDQDHDPHL